MKRFLLEKFPGILAIHEFHTWTFTPGTLVCTRHIIYQDQQVYQNINSQVLTFLSGQGFTIVTIQPEFPSSPEYDPEELSQCALSCKVRWSFLSNKYFSFIFQHEECSELTCCKIKVEVIIITHYIIKFYLFPSKHD